MSLLEIEGLTHAFGDTLLYKNASLTLHKGEHLGIVGANGAGKSTLVKICLGQVVLDSGQVRWQPRLQIGYLDQYAQVDGRLCLRDFLRTAFAPLYDLEAQLQKLYAKGSEAALVAAAPLQERLEQSDFYTLDTRIEQMARGLGLAAALERPIAATSGGQRMKAILAKLLLAGPDVLLLDEPTNFLDAAQVDWLAGYLAGLENAFMLVSHDAPFLARATNAICDIDDHALVKYHSNYTDFLARKAVRRQEYQKRYAAQQQEIQRTEEFIRRNIAGSRSKMARGRQKQLAHLVRLQAPEEKEPEPRFCFTARPLGNSVCLQVEHLTVGYTDALLTDLCFAVQGGQKLAVTGFNGVGKTTLLKTLLGQLPPLQGGYRFSTQVVTGYFAQDLLWPDGQKPPLQIVHDAFPALTEKEVRRQLARCGISERHARQPIQTLSGGEQAKVKLCLLTLTPCNFLILDEPTNHLDAKAKAALQAGLQQFAGAVLLVTHDAPFYRGWVQKVIKVEREAAGTAPPKGLPKKLSK